MSEQRAPYDIAPLTDDEFNQIFGSGKDAAPLTENDFAGILGDVPNLPAGWNYPERGERAPSADRVAAMRYKIDNQRQTLARLQAQYDQIKASSEGKLREQAKRLAALDLTLATLCDMVLGEDAADRSDGALVRAVGELQRDQLRAELKRANIQFAALTNIVNTHMMLSHDGATCMICGTVFVSKDRQAMADYCFTHTVLCAANVLTPIERKIIHGLRDERDAAIADRDNALIDVRNMQARLQRIIDANTQATRKLRAAIETQPQALPGSPDLVDELIAQRDAAILDARKLAQNWNGVMTSVEIESIVKKYLQQQ